MKRIVIAVNTVMTLMSSVYYAIKIKRENPETETALILQNVTTHKISLKQFSPYFNRIYTVPGWIPVWGILSVESIKNEGICYRYLHDSGISRYLRKEYDRDILMVGADYNGMMGMIINTYYKKKGRKKIILFEEGMALYSDRKRTWKDVLDYNLGREVEMQPVIGGSHKVDVIIAQHPEKLPEWKRKNKKIIRQSDIFADASIWKSILNRDAYLNKLSLMLQGKKVLLYLGQPIQEFSKKFRSKQETGLIEGMLRKMPPDYVMLVKAHLRDPANKYRKLQNREGCIVFDRMAGWHPVECLLSLFDVRMVMTFSSSAALNILDRVEACTAVYSYKYFDIPVAENWSQIYASYGDRVQVPASDGELDQVFAGLGNRQEENSQRNMRQGRHKNRAEDLNYIRRLLQD